MANLKCTLCEGKGRIPCAAEKCKYSTDGNHEIVIDEAIESTCTKEGKTEGSHCNLCNAIIVAQESTLLGEHNYVDGKCNECGIKDITISENILPNTGLKTIISATLIILGLITIGIIKIKKYKDI